MNLQAVLVYILPPVVGAGIGLFTNWLAIKMMFRPLREYRVLGLRVPFTPGILPRERNRIARSLGDTVATDLLDEATVAARLRSPAFKAAIKEAALVAGRKALESRPAELGSGLDRRIVALARESAVKALAGLASSATFSEAVSAGAGSAVELASGIQIAELLDRNTISRIARALAGPGGRDRVASGIAGVVMTALERAAAEGKAVSSFIDAEALRSFSIRVIDGSYPAMLKALDGILSDKSVAASMEKAGARIIRRALDRFNSVQRFFIGLGQYEKAILDNMPATIADFSEAVESLLAEPSTRSAVVARVSAAVVEFSGRPLSGMDFLSSPETRDAAREKLKTILSGAFSSIDPSAMEGIETGLLSHGTVGDVLEAFPGLSDSLGPALARWAAGLFAGGQDPARAAGRVAAAFFAGFATKFKERSADSPLGQTFAIDEATLESLSGAASEALAELAAAESSGVLRSIDIRELVVAKIDSLDMIEVERMILRVVDKELWAITMFGGILGAFIGILQSLLFLLR